MPLVSRGDRAECRVLEMVSSSVGIAGVLERLRGRFRWDPSNWKSVHLFGTGIMVVFFMFVGTTAWEMLKMCVRTVQSLNTLPGMLSRSTGLLGFILDGVLLTSIGARQST